MNTETPPDRMKLWLRAADVILVWNLWGVSVTVTAAVSLKSSATEDEISAMEEDISPWMAVNLFQTENFAVRKGKCLLWNQNKSPNGFSTENI